MLNKNVKDTAWFFNEKQILLESRAWWGDYGKGDSVGRTAFAYITYPNERWLKDAILQCVKQRDDTYVQFYRYPNEGADTMSRDHVGAIILALWINQDWSELDWILDNIPLRLSRRYRQTLDFWLWIQCLKAIRKGKKYAKILCNIFYFTNILLFLVTIPWNWILRRILRVKTLKVEQVEVENKKLKGWEKNLSKLIYPSFALFLLCWQVRILPESGVKGLLKDLLLMDVERENVVLRALLGAQITQEEYSSFKSINAFRWSIRYDRLCNIEPKLISEYEVRFNDINQDMLDYVYYGLDKIVIDMDPKLLERIKNNQSLIFY